MAKKTGARPKISTIKTSAELRRWYWLKTELAAEAKRVGVQSTGAKLTKATRITHNQFNQYTRDLLENNPELGMAAVRVCWAVKKTLPSKNGRHGYERSDLKLAKLT